MARHDGLRLQRGDGIQRRQPLVLQGGGVGIAEVLVVVAVDGVAGDDEAEGRHVQDGGVPRVGLAERDGAQGVAVEVEGEVVRGQGVEQGESVVLRRDLAGEEALPEGELRGGEGLLDVLDRGRGGEDAEAREGGAQEGDPEEVVAVAVGDVEGRKGLTGDGGADPGDEGVRLGGGEGGVDEDGGGGAVDQRDGDGGPGQVRVGWVVHGDEVRVVDGELERGESELGGGEAEGGEGEEQKWQEELHGCWLFSLLSLSESGKMEGDARHHGEDRKYLWTFFRAIIQLVFEKPL